MKEYGISLVQFVLSGKKQELYAFLSNLSPTESNKFVVEFFLLETYFSSLVKDRLVDYSGLPEVVIVDGIERPLTEADYNKARRKYDEGKNVPKEGLMSEATYLHCKSLVRERPYLRCKNLSHLQLSFNQQLFISELSNHLYLMYTQMKFSSLKQFADTSENDRILNIKYSSTWRILDKYATVSAYDIEQLKQTQSKVGKVLATLNGTDSAMNKELFTRLSDIIKETSNMQSVLGLINSSVTNMTIEEYIATLTALREHAGLEGLDIHDYEFNKFLTKFEKAVTAELSPDRIRHLELLSRDLESCLYF